MNVTGDSPPPDLVGAVLLVTVGGRTLTANTGPAPNTYAELQWDGLDAFGRPMQGPQPIDLCIAWAFPPGAAEVQPAPAGSTDSTGAPTGTTAGGTSFGNAPLGAYQVHLPGNPLGHDHLLLKCYGNGKSVAAAEIGAITKADKFRLGGLDTLTLSDGLGGWTVDQHHTLARATSTLYRGDGRERELSDEALWVAQRFAGNRSPQSTSAIIGESATGVSFVNPNAIAVDPSGSVYVATAGLVRVIRPDGTTELVAGTPMPGGETGGPVSVVTPAVTGCSGDGGPATSALLGPGLVGLAVDSSGGVYIADDSCSVVRYVDPAGIIQTVAGSGTSSSLPADIHNGIGLNGGDPLGASLASVTDIALTPDGDGLLIVQGPGVAGYLRLLTHDGKLLRMASFPNSSGDDLPSLPCTDVVEPYECAFPGTVVMNPPYNTIPALADAFPNPPGHHVPASAAELRELARVHAHGGRIYLGQQWDGVEMNIRVIDGYRGGPIYGFRTTYDVFGTLLNCGPGGCGWGEATELGPIPVSDLFADDNGLLYTTTSLNNDAYLFHAVDDVTIPRQRIAGGAEADLWMEGTDDVILASRLKIGFSTDLVRGPDGAIYLADYERSLVYRIARAVPPMYVSSWGRQRGRVGGVPL